MALHKMKKNIFKGIFDNWVHDFHHNPVLFWLEFVGTLGCVVASSSLAIMAPNPNWYLTYGAYLVGSSTLTVSSYMRNNGFWVVLNVFFATVDIIGLVNVIRA